MECTPVQQRTRLTRWHPTWTEVWPMGWTAWTSTLTWTTLGEVVSWESVGKGRRTRVSLTSCQTERQWQAEQISPRKQHRFTLLSETVNTLTSDGHETPPENPATELNTNSTPNTPNHSSVQQTPADETPSSWKCCLSHLPFLRRTPDQVWHPKRFLPNSSPSNDQNDALTIAGASHEESWTFHALPPNPTVAAVTRRQHATGEHTPALLHYHTTSVRCWRSPHPHMRIRHYEPWQLTCQNHDNTSELRKLHSVDYMLHLQDGVHTYVPEPLTAPQLVVLTARGGVHGHTHTMHHDGLPVPTGKSKPPTGKGGGSDPLTQTDNHMHHTSIIIVILGKHIATMLRHNPYSLLRSTARTNLVERSYSQFFFSIII